MCEECGEEFIASASATSRLALSLSDIFKDEEEEVDDDDDDDDVINVSNAWREREFKLGLWVVVVGGGRRVKKDVIVLYLGEWERDSSQTDSQAVKQLSKHACMH